MPRRAIVRWSSKPPEAPWSGASVALGRVRATKAPTHRSRVSSQAKQTIGPPTLGAEG
jgi:hypothetical protein